MTNLRLHIKLPKCIIIDFLFLKEVYRKSTGTRLISSREYAESYVFSDRYQQLFLRLATENVFGFGENTHETFRHNFNVDSLTYSVFARDEPPSGKAFLNKKNKKSNKIQMNISKVAPKRYTELSHFI